jgi:hypothetical protein
MNALQQVNITYMPEQDRLLLKAGTSTGQEYRVWITRRYAGLLAQVLQKHIDKSGGTHQLASDPQTTNHLRQGAFDKAYESGRSGFPLGEDGVLGYAIKVNSRGNDGLALQLLPKEGEGMTLNLDAPLLYLMANLLEQATLQADWKLPGTSGLPAHLH